MLFAVGDLTHADVLHILIFAFLNHHFKIWPWMEHPHRQVIFVHVFEHFVQTGAANAGALTLSRPALFDFRNATAVKTAVLGQFEPTIRMGDLSLIHI